MLVLSLVSIRFAPPLVIEEADLRKGIEVIAESLRDLDLVRSISTMCFSILNAA